MNAYTLHGWVSEMEKIEDYYSRWGSSLEKTAAKEPGVRAMYGGVTKDKRKKSDMWRALPAVAATLGAAAAFKQYRGKKDLLKNMFLYSGTGATTGWLPLVYRDAYRTLKARTGSQK